MGNKRFQDEAHKVVQSICEPHTEAAKELKTRMKTWMGEAGKRGDLVDASFKTTKKSFDDYCHALRSKGSTFRKGRQLLEDVGAHFTLLDN